MKNPVALFLTVLSLLLFSMAYSQPQRRANIWHFGAAEGLDFSCGYPEKLTGINVFSFEGSTTLCDENGEVLFYSNGGGSKGVIGIGNFSGMIWNRNQEIMLDLGTESGGGLSSAQSAIALPIPGQTHRYYLFTIDHYPSLTQLNVIHRGLRYFVIDMSRNNGLGEVVTGDIQVYRPAVECLTAMRHANGQDYWIITIDVDTKEWIVVPVTSQGVSPVLRFPRAVAHFPFVIKASPDGRFLSDGSVLYSFNAGTGEPQQIAILGEYHNYCFSFSPGSRYYYTPNTMGERKILRYDMLAADIPASKAVVSAIESTSLGYMQMAPDGNLYYNAIMFPSFVRLYSIRCPDAEAATVEDTGINFNTDPSSNFLVGLNNVADFWLHQMEYTLEADTFSRRLCPEAPLKLETACPGEHYTWSSGDTTSTLEVQTPGEYRVSITNACFTVVETYQVFASESPVVNIEHKAFDNLCDVLPLQLNAIAESADSLFWSTGETTSSITILEGGRYEVTALNTCGTATHAVVWSDELCCKIYTPNAFSPNQDGINDLFTIQPHHCDFGDYRLRIYSRWGEMVFETDSPAVGWDGRRRQAPFSQGVYLWVLDYRLVTGGDGAWQRQSDVVHLTR